MVNPGVFQKKRGGGDYFVCFLIVVPCSIIFGFQNGIISTIKMPYFYHILSRFSDEMRVSGDGGPTPSILDPSMLIYFSQ